MINMKHKLLYTPLSAGSLISFISCEDFLDEQPRGKAIAEKLEHYEGLFNSGALSSLSLDTDNYYFWKNDATKRLWLHLNS